MDTEFENIARKLKKLYVRGVITREALRCQLDDHGRYYRQKNRSSRPSSSGESHVNLDIRFFKTGAQIKVAAAGYVEQLQQRLDRRNELLDEFMNDRQMVRSFLVRSSKGSWGHGSFTWPKDAIASEQLEETRQLCERIYDLERQIYQLRLVIAHLDDDREFELTLEEMMSYGFNPESESPATQ